MPATVRRLVTLPLLLLGLLLAGTLLTAPGASAHQGATGREERIHDGVAVAKRQIGDRYRYGAEGPKAFDCSGLTYFSFRRAGFDHFPRTAAQQYDFVRHIRKSKLRRGDFMYFHHRGSVYHVAVFLGWRDGKRKLLHSPSTGSRVGTTTEWTSSWYAGTLRRR